MNKIGVGLCTYNRPKYFDKSSKAIVRTLLPYIDRFVIYNDGSEVSYQKSYSWLEKIKSPKIKIIHNSKNNGVGYAKNQLFRELMKDCEYIFIAEDDMIPQNKMAVLGYLAAARITGIEHFLFSHHGPANDEPTALIDRQGPIEYYKACVGAWCFYTKNALEKAGLMDEGFDNAWEHVEHTHRIFKSFELPYGYYPDVVGSRDFIKEIPGSINNSSIGILDDPKRIKVIIKGLEYWKKKEKGFPAQHTLDYFTNLLREKEDK